MTPTNTPAKKRHFLRSYPKVIRWKHGEESKFWLRVKYNGPWLPPLYSHDVRSATVAKTPATELPDAEKIARLKALFEKGGTRGVKFSPQLVDVAYIAEKGKLIGEAFLIYQTGVGWYSPTAKSAQFADKKFQHDSGWKLWMAGVSGFTEPQFTLYGKYDDPAFLAFAAALPQARPDIMERFTDPETGELSRDFLMAAWLGQVARGRAAKGHPKAYLYRNKEIFCRIDLADGRLCPLMGGSAWITLEHFGQTPKLAVG